MYEDVGAACSPCRVYAETKTKGAKSLTIPFAADQIIDLYIYSLGLYFV